MKILLLFFIFISFGLQAQLISYHLSKPLGKGMGESSGLAVASDTSFYTINDSGNESYLFEINHQGRLIRKIKIEAKNYDWEDLATDEDGNLFIGDFGNNNNKRKNLRILRIYKRQLKQSTIKPVIHEFSYPDQKNYPPEKSKLYYDCEGFIVKGRYAYLFIKNRTEPFDGISKVYRIDINAGRNSIVKVGQIQLCKGGWYPCSVTSASYDHKSGQLLLLTYSKILVFNQFNFSSINSNKYKEVFLNKIEQFESITHHKSGNLFLTSEKHKLLGGNHLHKVRIK